MKRDDVLQLGAYVVAAGLAVGGAFIVSSRFLASVRAQEETAAPAAAAPSGENTPATNSSPDPAAQPQPGGSSVDGTANAGASSPPPAPDNVPPAPAPPDASAGAPAPADGAGGSQYPTGAMPAAPQTQDVYSQPGGAGSFGTNSGIAELEGFLEPFIYDIVNRRDPFQAYAEYVPVDMEGPPRALSPAQRWELEQLKLVGIMWDVKDPKAMFLDPEDEVMILGRDESIGNRNGYIAAIREGEVIVVEAIRKRGDIIYRTRVLRIER